MNTPNKITREYRIDAGNSGTGPIGFVLYVMAQSPEAALEWAKQEIGEEAHVKSVVDSKTGELLHLHVYFNPDALTLADVWDVETDKCCAPASKQTPAVYTGCERAADVILSPVTDYSGRSARIAAIISKETAAPAMYQALERANNTIRSLLSTIKTVDSDERFRARAERREANVHAMEIRQSNEAQTCIEAALAAAQKGGAL